mgnify:CR=1 FL=1
MSGLSISLAVLALLILISGLIYTFKIGKISSIRQSEYDTEINEKVQRHPALLNPVFLAYIIGIGLALLYLVYVAVSFY